MTSKGPGNSNRTRGKLSARSRCVCLSSRSLQPARLATSCPSGQRARTSVSRRISYTPSSRQTSLAKRTAEQRRARELGSCWPAQGLSSYVWLLTEPVILGTTLKCDRVATSSLESQAVDETGSSVQIGMLPTDG